MILLSLVQIKDIQQKHTIVFEKSELIWHNAIEEIFCEERTAALPISPVRDSCNHEKRAPDLIWIRAPIYCI